MRLSKKVLLIIGFTWLLFIGIFYGGASHFLIGSFLKVENRQMINDTLRAQKAIDRVSYALSTFTTDWAHWNDAYEYVAGNNPTFAEKNITLEALSNSNINVLIYFTKTGKTVIGVASDTENKKFIPYPKGLEAFLQQDSPLVRRPNIKDDLKGLIYLPSGIMLVAATSMSYGDMSKPINGTLLTGRNFSSNLLETVSNSASLNLSLLLPPQIEIDPTLKIVYEKTIQASDGNYVMIGNKDIIYGYTLLRDIYKKPIGMIRVTVEREVYKSGKKAIQYFFSGFFIVGFMLITLLWYLIRIMIVARLERLNKEINYISDKKDYAYRLDSGGNDEITSLAKQVNEMMNVIQVTHQQLANQVQQLSVSEKHLAKMNQQLINEIKEKKIVEERAEELQSKLLVSARQAGMAEVATSILHNVGNILNSVKVSIGYLTERSAKLHVKNLLGVVGLIKQNKDNLPVYLTEDSKGKLLPEYLLALSKTLDDESDKNKQELKSLQGLIKHIEDIVAMQKTISGSSSGIVEKVFLPDLIDTAIGMCENSSQIKIICIDKEILDKQFLMTDKSKVLQILVNLIKNAKDALTDNDYGIPCKKVIIRVQSQKDNPFVDIAVIDNGVGVLKENLIKIFSQGFTTKPTGHGFGLHSSILAAKDLGGSLNVSSDGLGQGATFVLTLPLLPN